MKLSMAWDSTSKPVDAHIKGEAVDWVVGSMMAREGRSWGWAMPALKKGGQQSPTMRKMKKKRLRHLDLEMLNVEYRDARAFATGARSGRARYVRAQPCSAAVGI